MAKVTKVDKLRTVLKSRRRYCWFNRFDVDYDTETNDSHYFIYFFRIVKVKDDEVLKRYTTADIEPIRFHYSNINKVIKEYRDELNYYISLPDKDRPKYLDLDNNCRNPND